jgi:hypothetical protein
MIPLDANDEIKDLESDASRHFSYVRYNANLSEEGLAELGLGHIDADEIRQMDSVEHIAQLREVGETVGRKQVAVKTQLRNFISKEPA